MKTIKLGIATLFIVLLGACSSSSTKTYSNFDEAAEDATASINQAKSANYEWRDSRKILAAAEKLNKAGKKDDAIKMAVKAKQQAMLAVAQSELESGTTGPR